MTTPPDLDRFIDLYLGISREHFGEESTAKSLRLTGQTGQDHASLMRFSETEFNGRVQDLARVASRLAPLPDFHFLYSNAGSFDAQAAPNLSKPLIRLDASLVTFWFLLSTVLVFLRYSAPDRAQQSELCQMAQSTIDGFLLERSFPDKDIALYEAWWQRDQHLSEIAAGLSRVIAYFVVLHEMAHLTQSPDLSGFDREFTADRRAAQAFVQVRATPDLRWATFPEGYLTAPVVLFDIQRMTRKRAGRLGMQQLDRTHPSPYARRRALERYVRCDVEMDQALHYDLRFSAARVIATL